MAITPPVDYAGWMKLHPQITKELLARTTAGILTTRTALEGTFRELFGAEGQPADETRFLIFAAPIARKIAIGLADRNDRLGDSSLRVQALVEWIGWLDRFDPMCAAMIDLHYFARLSISRTATMLRVPPESVVRELRFAKAWLQTNLDKGLLPPKAASPAA